SILDSLGLRVQQLRHYSISLPGGMNESRSDRERLIRAYYERDAQLAAALSRSTVLRALARIEHSGWRGME
ncbi:MAG: GntR family transcriptional regulator, partial [Vulcanimicrobiaceae bacterium]